MSDVANRKTQPIASLSQSQTARLSILAGDAAVGTVHNLNEGANTIGGAQTDLDLSADSSIVSKQANITYEEGVVTIEDLGEHPSVFVHVKGAVPVKFGQPFLIGDQRVRVVEVDEDRDYTWKDGTRLFTSPRRKATFAVQHLLRGGRIGASASNSEDVVSIGAANAQLNLGHCDFVSTNHAVVRRDDGGSIVVEDKNATNGVYVSINGKHVIENGSTFWIGRQLIRLDL